MILKNALILSFIFIVNISVAQIKGSYIYSAGMDSGSRTLTFEGSNFRDESSGHVSGTYGEGSFKMQNNYLTLTYFKIEDKDSSVYRIESSKVLYGYSTIVAHIFSDDKSPENGAPIILRNSKLEPIFSVNTHSNGMASFTIYKSEEIKFLTVDLIGYNRVIIPFNALKDRRNEIFADLKVQKTYIFEQPHTDVYRVLKFDGKILTLQDADKQEFIFKKLD